MKLKILSGMTVTMVMVILAACGSQSSQSAKVEPPKKEFKMVEVPAVMTSSEQRAVYVVENYWHNFDYADTSLISMPEVSEQAFVDFIQVLPHTSPEVVRRGIDRNLSDAQRASPEMFAHMQMLYQRYLYDPNSPMRNEDIYIIYLQSVLENPLIEDIDKVRPQYELDLALKNRAGSIATDFKFTDANQRINTLRKSLKGDYTLLFFNNPDCPACAQIKSELKASPLISQLLSAGKFSIVAIYIDQELDQWRAAASQIPSSWINGYTDGQTAEMSKLYDLRAIPTLYLLDAKGRVVLKDQPFAIVEQYLSKKR